MSRTQQTIYINVAEIFPGRAALLLVRDVLEKLNLTHTLTVFEAEAGLEVSSHTSCDILAMYNIDLHARIRVSHVS